MRQTSFAAGELSPLLWGRTDLELWRHGARRLSNFVVNRQGSAVSRSGFRRAWAAKATAAALLPLLHPSGESYVLEFTHLAVRIYQVRGFLLIAELVTPFQSGDLPELQYAQVGDTVLLTHRLRPPQELIVGAVATIQPARFGPDGDNLADAPMAASFPSIGGNPPALPVLVAWQTGHATLWDAGAAYPPREWNYKVSTLLRHNLTGKVVESLPRDITQYVTGNVLSGSVPTVAGAALPLPSNMLVLYPSAPIYIEPGLGDAVTPAANWTPIENLYYRGRGGLFGLVGRAPVNARFADFGEEPDYRTPPLRGASPFRAGEYPAACAFFQQRRVLGGTGARPSTFWMSAVDDWTNNDEPLVNWAGQPLEATLVNRRRESIVGMAQLEHLFVLTDTAVWCVGRSDVPIDYDTFSSVVRVVDDHGALPLQPLVVEGAVLYGRERGRGVRAIVPTDTGFGGLDVSWVAEHLFRTRDARVVSWCYQREPWNVVWLVTDAGVLLSVSRTGNGTWAWARHDVGGRVLSVCSVPQDDADLVFIAVQRSFGSLQLQQQAGPQGATSVECLTPHVIGELPRYVSDPLYSGNAIGSEQTSYPVDGYVVATVTKATGTTVTGLSHLEGREVWASCPGIAPVLCGTVVSGEVATPAGWGPQGATTFKAAIGLGFICELETLDAAPGTTSMKTVTAVGFELDGAQGVEVGEDFDHLVPWQQRDVSNSYAYPSAATTLAIVKVRGSWRPSGRAVLRQATPLPVTVLGVTRELETGGK